MNLFLFLAGVFLLTFILGKMLQRMHIPWIFSALLIGLGLSAYNPFSELTGSPVFKLMAEFGMYMLLFIVGFKLNVKEMLHQGRFIVKTTFVVILSETIVGSLIIHYYFSTPWLIAIVVGASFSTVGEAVLLPILQNFGLIRTSLGQTIIGISVLDDVLELITVIIASVLVGLHTGYSNTPIGMSILVLFMLLVGAWFLMRQRHRAHRMRFIGFESFFFFIIAVFLLFLGIGEFADMAPLGAILAGIALRNFAPASKVRSVDSNIQAMAYGLFAPVFFLWVGIDTDVRYLIASPLLILAIMLAIKATKILSSYVMGHKKLGSHQSIIMGICLAVKFSTSIAIIRILFDSHLISLHLYSILIAVKIGFKFVVPLLLAYLIPHWHIAHTPDGAVRS